MNDAAQKHLVRAEGFLAKGDDFYHRAAEEIVAAKEADFSLTNAQIGERFGRSEKWVRNIVSWGTSSEPETTPVDWQRGSHATTAEVAKAVAKTLKDPAKRNEAIDALSAKERAQLATDLVAQPEVKEAIKQAGPLAIEQHLELTDDIVQTATEKTKRKQKEVFKTAAARSAAERIEDGVDLLDKAALELVEALAEIIQYDVKTKHDSFGRVRSGLVRIKRSIAEIEDALGDDEEEVDEIDTSDIYIA